MNMKETIIEIAKKNQADAVGFAPISRFADDDPVRKIMPETKTVICLVFRTLRGMYRGIEEGTTYYQYSTMAVENLEETVMPGAALRVANYIEANGYTALPQRRHQIVMAEKDSTNPEVLHDLIYRDRPEENQMNFIDSAVKCGVGEKSLHGVLLTDDFGPMVRYCFVLTDAEIEPDEVVTPHLCDGCGDCVKACPGHAIAKDGTVDIWQCATYYKGASGIRNPFMNPDAFPDFEDRLAIIAGEAKLSPERAKEILAKIAFYPPVGQSYCASICGRCCDIDCYVHLEKKGVLNRSFATEFRKRDKWGFDLSDFDVINK